MADQPVAVCACGKVIYTHDEANRRVDHLRTLGQYRGKPKAALNAYRCVIVKDGRRWHVGHEPNATQRLQAQQQGSEHLAAAKARAREYFSKPPASRR